MTRVLFLFNHDAAHQAAHIAGIAAALARRGSVQVVMAYATAGIRRVVADVVPADVATRMDWVPLTLPPALRTVLVPLDRLAPASRVARLHAALDLFRSVDIVVSTERTCLRVKRRLGAESPRFVYVPHGSGDRNVAYHPELAQFDLMLLSGPKLVDGMVDHGLATPERCRVIGYPKFDTVDIAARPAMFANDDPVFLYNPHFDPHLSSWYTMGPAVIEAFVRSGLRANLIVAPHVMLFRKRIHYSLEYRTVRVRPDMPSVAADNILVDLGSERLFDMTYTRAADVYIGDVSSQVYEFLAHRGACFFLDPTGRGAPDDYEFWRNGDVCTDVARLAALLPQWRERAAHYRGVQDRLFASTIDVVPGYPAVERGADALLAYAASPRTGMARA